ncbi:type II secretion system F family protein [Lacrimispora saccharolytica]|uniref:Type II secretion system F domain protein n=1 Tax=Lacrimispora saccharolytica (strain ATCC 35040 / DSM 2544 / NRCC 2533 / WM1) TaxID=610130 RepID=D9R0X7_LACSW|nr:type II secretion system F family protein [Lacrimispora saccharolytica]ADL02776.1 Type II secretion system F domain protein [[Clostridium] saccharolyticum WM1]QRV19013.1 type II secretion system F family protein [Lacrimispora saccharolytica]
MRYDNYVLTPAQWFLYGFQGLAAAGIFSYVFYRSVASFLLFLPMIFIFPHIKKSELKKKRLQQLNLEFKEGILLLASFLSAGYSVENAFSASVKELVILYGEEGMVSMEFGHIVSQIRINRSVEQALSEFAGRSGLDDVKNFAEVFAAAKRSGGELVSIISHTAAVIRDKMQVRQEILTMTASKQFEQKIMTMIPFFIVLYIDMTSPGFFNIMYNTGIGRILMTLCLAVYIGAIAIARHIMKIEI